MPETKRSLRNKILSTQTSSPLDPVEPPEPSTVPEEDGTWSVIVRLGASPVTLFQRVSKPFALSMYRMLTGAVMNGSGFEYVGKDAGLNLVDGNKISAVHMRDFPHRRKSVQSKDDPDCKDCEDCEAEDVA